MQKNAVLTAKLLLSSKKGQTYNNKTENTKKQGKREKTAATPNKGRNQTTETVGNYEAWPPLTPPKTVGYPDEVLEKLSSLDAKMSGLETLTNNTRER